MQCVCAVCKCVFDVHSVFFVVIYTVCVCDGYSKNLVYAVCVCFLYSAYLMHTIMYVLYTMFM